MDTLQHKQYLMAIIFTSLLPKRQKNGEYSLDSGITKVEYEAKELAKDAEIIVNAIIEVSEKSKLLNSEHNDY